MEANEGVTVWRIVERGPLDGCQLEVGYSGHEKRRALSGFLLPPVFSVRAHGGKLIYLVEMEVEVVEHVPSCRRLTCVQREGGPSLRNTHLRIPVHELLRESTSMIALRSERSGSDFRVAPVSVQHAGEVKSDVVTPERRPITRARLEKAAATYREQVALDSRRATIRSAAALGLSRSQFDRLRTAAVEAGLLEKNLPPGASADKKGPLA